MSKPAGFVFYPDKFLFDADSLSDAAFRAYLKILCWMWRNSEDHCSIKNDEKTLRRATNFSQKKLSRVVKEIQQPGSELLKIEGDRLVSNGLRKEAQRHAEIRDKRKRAAEKRWQSNDANAMHMECKGASRLHSVCNAHETETETKTKLPNSDSLVPAPSFADSHREPSRAAETMAGIMGALGFERDDWHTMPLIDKVLSFEAEPEKQRRNWERQILNMRQHRVLPEFELAVEQVKEGKTGVNRPAAFLNHKRAELLEGTKA